MAEELEPIERVNARLAWVGVEEVPITFVNQILGQVDDQGEAILTFGQASPPVLLGTPEEQRQMIAAIPFVQVKPVARISLPAHALKSSLTC